MSAKLAAPTHDELVRIWTGTHPSWGAALSLEDYLDREASQVTIPLSVNGGLSRWILTTDASPPPSAGGSTSPSPSRRPVLSSCETLRKRALVRDAGTARGLASVRDVVAHGVASVFTDEEFRRNGYAGAMMGRLGEALGKGSEEPLFSVLYSDVGKVFYAKQGWMPFESTHLEFPASSSSSSSSPGNLKPIGPHDIDPLADADEAILRRTLADAATSPKSRVALLPSADQFGWHIAREAFQCQHLLGRTPTTHGVIYTIPSSSSSSSTSSSSPSFPPPRVWAIWKRNHSAPADQPGKNTLFILRFVVENDHAISDGDLSEAIEAIVNAARREAASWACSKVEMWNPDERVRRLAEGNEALEAKFVVREQDSITALRWFGQGSADDVEWIANEKYAWC